MNVRHAEDRDRTALLAIINEAAQAYRGVIPEDRWHDPYMPESEFLDELASGVIFWVAEEAGTLLGGMGIQDKGAVALIRHAYVSPAAQRKGVGRTLLQHVAALTAKPVLIGTWADASWAIDFYSRNGFTLVPPAEAARLLRTYWSIPDRQIETSVVLADQRWVHEADRADLSSTTKLIAIWRFVRGDVSPAHFERWAYEHGDDLEAMLGKADALLVLAADYRSPEGVTAVKEALRRHAVRLSPLRCQCVTLADVAVVDMGADDEAVMSSIEKRRSRGEPLWWLWCGECTRCGEWWLVAQEERQNDVFCLRRLTQAEVGALLEHDAWPHDFDTYESLLRIGRDAGRSVRFVDPEDSSLQRTMSDLAKARPGIRVSELADLLNLDADVAGALARRAVREDGVSIEFDG